MVTWKGLLIWVRISHVQKTFLPHRLFWVFIKKQKFERSCVLFNWIFHFVYLRLAMVIFKKFLNKNGIIFLSNSFSYIIRFILYNYMEIFVRLLVNFLPIFGPFFDFFWSQIILSPTYARTSLTLKPHLRSNFTYA